MNQVKWYHYILFAGAMMWLIVQITWEDFIEELKEFKP